MHARAARAADPHFTSLYLSRHHHYRQATDLAAVALSNTAFRKLCGAHCSGLSGNCELEAPSLCVSLGFAEPGGAVLPQSAETVGSRLANLHGASPASSTAFLLTTVWLLFLSTSCGGRQTAVSLEFLVPSYMGAATYSYRQRSPWFC